MHSYLLDMAAALAHLRDSSNLDCTPRTKLVEMAAMLAVDVVEEEAEVEKVVLLAGVLAENTEGNTVEHEAAAPAEAVRAKEARAAALQAGRAFLVVVSQVVGKTEREVVEVMVNRAVVEVREVEQEMAESGAVMEATAVVEEVTGSGIYTSSPILRSTTNTCRMSSARSIPGTSAAGHQNGKTQSNSEVQRNNWDRHYPSTRCTQIVPVRQQVAVVAAVAMVAVVAEETVVEAAVLGAMAAAAVQMEVEEEVEECTYTNSHRRKSVCHTRAGCCWPNSHTTSHQ